MVQAADALQAVLLEVPIGWPMRKEHGLQSLVSVLLYPGIDLSSSLFSFPSYFFCGGQSLFRPTDRATIHAFRIAVTE